MSREALIEALTDASIETYDHESDEVLREAVIANMEDETIDGLDDYRDAVRENAEPEEIFEWWRVDNWLADQLKEIGEPVLDNDYGQWYGRTTTGQSMLMDGVLQRIASKFA